MIPVRARAQDVPDVQDFLIRHSHRAMFPLINLTEHGLSGAYTVPPLRSMTVWILRDAGLITGLVCLTDEGMLMPVLPGMQDPWAALRDAFGGHTFIGALGEAGNVRHALRELALDIVPARRNADEKHFALRLDALKPAFVARMHLQPLSYISRETAVEWRSAYAEEVLGLADPSQAERDIDSYIAKDSHRVLLDGTTPVALTGFNARTEDCVQVGGVYTPPHLRGRGYASAALSLHLAEARASGATEATLFAASEGAARIYARLGFRQIGEFALVLFRQPVIYGT